jgi:hypothetical protein
VGGRTLIISSGDISDVDGFFALAEYSKVFLNAACAALCCLNLNESTCPRPLSAFDSVFCPPKTGADVFFVMNYPAYVGEENKDDSYHIHQPGLGYKYSSDQVCLLSLFAFLFRVSTYHLTKLLDFVRSLKN